MKSESILKEAGEMLNKALTQELRDQGHYLTGALENSINNSFRIEKTIHRFTLRGFALDYSIDLEEGLGPKSRKLPTVEELRKYFLLRGLSVPEATMAAGFTRKKHQKEGMSTEASSRFSKTGERQKFISISWEKSEKIVDNMIIGKCDKIFEEETAKQKSERI